MDKSLDNLNFKTTPPMQNMSVLYLLVQMIPQLVPDKGLYIWIYKLKVHSILTKYRMIELDRDLRIGYKFW